MLYQILASPPFWLKLLLIVLLIMTSFFFLVYAHYAGKLENERAEKIKDNHK